jgi:hypothetical protein
MYAAEPMLASATTTAIVAMKKPLNGSRYRKPLSALTP